MAAPLRTSRSSTAFPCRAEGTRSSITRQPNCSTPASTSRGYLIRDGQLPDAPTVEAVREYLGGKALADVSLVAGVHPSEALELDVVDLFAVESTVGQEGGVHGPVAGPLDDARTGRGAAVG
jgi:hypothetical protein